MLANLPGDDLLNFEGVVNDYDPLNLNMSDDDILSAIGNRVNAARDFWNDKLHLDDVRKQNELAWLSGVPESGLYEYQIPYTDNRVFMSTEQLVPMVTANPAAPIVIEAQDTDASRELANNIRKMLLTQYEENGFKIKFEKVARHLIIGLRNAVMKYKWNTEMGRLLPDGTRKGNVEVMTLRPQNVVLEYGGNDDVTDIPLIAEQIETTLEEIAIMFPDKRNEIMILQGKENGIAKPLSSRVSYREIWFSYYDKKNKNEKREAVAWKMDYLLLDAMKNPNWNYDEYEKDAYGNLRMLNFLDRPQKPYVVFNFLNTGRYVYDDTSLPEQARSIQQNLNRRNRQIVENADSANSGLIFNTEMIDQEDIAEITGDPMEKIGVKGDVRSAAARLPSLMLPDYVLEDKYDARREIDAIFGTEAPLRGEKSGNKTATQDVLSQRANMTRSQTITSALERGASMLYRGMVQMYKVFYDVEDYERYTGSDGKTTFFMFSRDRIEDGIQIKIKAGSMLPEDPLSKEERTVKLAPSLDPLSIAQGLGVDDPQEFAKRLFLFQFAPDRYATEVLSLQVDGNTDHKAILDIKELNEGKVVPPQRLPTQSHIAQHQAYIEDPMFKMLSPEIQNAHVSHVAQETLLVKQALAGQQPAGLLGMLKQAVGLGR